MHVIRVPDRSRVSKTSCFPQIYRKYYSINNQCSRGSRSLLRFRPDLKETLIFEQMVTLRITSTVTKRLQAKKNEVEKLVVYENAVVK